VPESSSIVLAKSAQYISALWSCSGVANGFSSDD
jgi:hypothetical protein